MQSRLCTIRFPAHINRHPAGLLLGDELVPWADVRAVGILTWISMASVDMDYVVIQTVGGHHHWIEVCGFCDLAEWNVRNWTDETIARLQAWWAATLAGLDMAPASLSFGSVALLGIVQWPPHERGQPMYAERPRRLFGFLPWGTELAPRLQ